MEIRFYIDPDTNLPHIYKHQVQEQEEEEVLSQPREDSIFVITAYELRGKPLAADRRRRKK